MVINIKEKNPYDIKYDKELDKINLEQFDKKIMYVLLKYQNKL